VTCSFLRVSKPISAQPPLWVLKINQVRLCNNTQQRISFSSSLLGLTIFALTRLHDFNRFFALVPKQHEDVREKQRISAAFPLPILSCLGTRLAILTQPYLQNHLTGRQVIPYTGILARYIMPLVTMNTLPLQKSDHDGYITMNQL